MPFWSKKSNELQSASHPRGDFNARFGTRREAIKRLSEEAEELDNSLHSLDLDGLNSLEEKSIEIIRIRDAYVEDANQEVARNPAMLQVFPTLLTMFDKYSDEAEKMVLHARRHRDHRYPQHSSQTSL